MHGKDAEQVVVFSYVSLWLQVDDKSDYRTSDVLLAVLGEWQAKDGCARRSEVRVTVSQ